MTNREPIGGGALCAMLVCAPLGGLLIAVFALWLEAVL